MDKTISVQVDEERFTTGMMLELMELQPQLAGNDPHVALGKMLTLLQTVVTEIKYGEESLSTLKDLPFRQLRPVMTKIMAAVNQTDPN